MGEMFKMMAGVDLVHVPYRASYFPDLLGGQVQVVFSPLTSVIEYIRDGRLRGLAVATATRWTPLPDIPAMDEFVPGYDASGWNGIGAPKKHIHCDHRKAQQRDQRHHHRTQYEGAPFRLRPLSMTPAEFGKRIADDTEKWAKVVKFAGIKGGMNEPESPHVLKSK